MARLTVRDFAKSVGLATSGGDYIACTVMLKMLCAKGVAKEVDRINTSSRGRKSVVYELPEQVSFTLDLNPVVEEPVAETPVEETVVEPVVEETVTETVTVVEDAEPVVEQAEPEVVSVTEAVTEQKFYYDDDEDEAA